MFVRTTENRSLLAANRGKSSVNCMPVVRVEIAANGPRNSAGALGLGSNKSKWLGPPTSQINITDRAFRASTACTNGALPKIPAAKGNPAPNRRNERRVRPWQSRVR